MPIQVFAPEGVTPLSYEEFLAKRDADKAAALNQPPLPEKMLVYVYSKYKFIGALAEIGKADEFFTFLDSLPRVQQEMWYAANELRSDDALIVAMLPVLPQALGCSIEQLNALLVKSYV